MPGFAFWNAEMRAFSCAWASLLVPGRSPATVIVIVFFLVDDSAAAATESARHAIASRQTAARVLRLCMNLSFLSSGSRAVGPSLAYPHERVAWSKWSSALIA